MPSSYNFYLRLANVAIGGDNVFTLCVSFWLRVCAQRRDVIALTTSLRHRQIVMSMTSPPATPAVRATNAIANVVAITLRNKE